ALFVWPLATRNYPVESLQLRQYLRCGGGRHPRLLSDLFDSNPFARANQERMQHLRATPREQGPNGLRQRFGARPVDVEINTVGREEEAAATVMVAHPFAPQQLLGSGRNRLGKQEGSRLLSSGPFRPPAGRFLELPQSLPDITRIEGLLHLDQ